MVVMMLVFLLAGVAMIAAAYLSLQAGHGALAQRVDLVAAPAARTDALRGQSWFGAAQAAIHTFFGAGLSHRWGARLSGWMLVVCAIAAAVGGGLLAGAVLKLPIWAVVLATALAFYGVPRLLLSFEQGRADVAFVDNFPDAIDMVNRMLRAGLPITSAIRTVANEAASPVNTVFSGLADQVEIGIPLDTALEAAAKRIDLPDFRYFTVAVSLQSGTGGNLIATLEILAEVIRKRRAMRMKARAVTAEVRLTAWILGAIPLVLVALMLIISPNYLAPLVEDPRGNMISLSAIAGLVIGFLSMRQMMRSVTAV